MNFFSLKIQANVILFFLLFTITACTSIKQTDEPGDTIVVGRPKVYDEKSLADKLANSRAQLAQIVALNGNQLTTAIGGVQGGRLSSTSVGLAATSVPSSGVVSVDSTSSTQSTTLTDVVGTEPSATTEITDSVGSTPSVTTTQPGIEGAIPNAPAVSAAFTPGTSFGVSARDLLAEQVQLTYEIANLQFLLERSISDRITYINPEKGYAARMSALIGFPISLEPGVDQKNQLAEIDVTVCTETESITRETKESEGRFKCTNSNKWDVTYNESAPSLVALMPTKNTYNVASLQKSSKSIGLGVIVNVISLGVNAGKRTENYFLVKDTDTLAYQRLDAIGRLRFGWQFRPVFDRRIVEPGIRQVLALIALKELEDPEAKAERVCLDIKTRWRKFDRKTQSARSTRDEWHSNLECIELWLPNQWSISEGLEPKIIDYIDWKDAGAGNLLVMVKGHFLTQDISVAFGKTVLTNGNGLQIDSERRMRFTIPATALLSGSRPFMRTRYGHDVALEFKPEDKEDKYAIQGDDVATDVTPLDLKSEEMKILKAEVTAISSDKAKLTVEVDNGPKKDFRPIVQVGTKVYLSPSASFSTNDNLSSSTKSDQSPSPESNLWVYGIATDEDIKQLKQLNNKESDKEESLQTNKKTFVIIESPAFFKTANVVQILQPFWGEKFRDEHYIDKGQLFFVDGLINLAKYEVDCAIIKKSKRVHISQNPICNGKNGNKKPTIGRYRLKGSNLYSPSAKPVQIRVGSNIVKEFEMQTSNSLEFEIIQKDLNGIKQLVVERGDHLVAYVHVPVETKKKDPVCQITADVNQFDVLFAEVECNEQNIDSVTFEGNQLELFKQKKKYLVGLTQEITNRPGTKQLKVTYIKKPKDSEKVEKVEKVAFSASIEVKPIATVTAQ